MVVLSLTHNHSGQWDLTKDATEFINLPDNLKETMRKEKTKRIKTVLSELNFVLDSDEQEEAPGKWTCCAATSYYGSCSK